MKLNALIAAGALASGAVTAWADTTNAGALASASSNSSGVPTAASGGVSDPSSFQLLASANAAPASVITISVPAQLSVSNIRISVLDDSPNAVNSGGSGTSSILFDQALTAGNPYFFQVTGIATGLGGGTFPPLPVLTPVPEPGSYALMLSGLLGVAVFVRRRRQT